MLTIDLVAAAAVLIITALLVSSVARYNCNSCCHISLLQWQMPWK
jgi:hypothetical protein